MGDFFTGGGTDSIGNMFGGGNPGGSSDPGGSSNFTDPMSGMGMSGPGGDMGNAGPTGDVGNVYDTGGGPGTSGANVFTPGGGEAPAATINQAQQTATPPPPGGGTPTGQPSGQNSLMDQIAKILGVSQANAAPMAGQRASGDAAFGGPPAGTQTTSAPSWPTSRGATGSWDTAASTGTPAVDDMGRPIPGTGGPTAAPGPSPAGAAIPPGGGVPTPPNPAAQTGVGPPAGQGFGGGQQTQATNAPAQNIGGDTTNLPPITVKPDQGTTGTTGDTTGTTTAAPDATTGGAPVSPGQAGQQGFNPMTGIMNLIGNLLGVGNLGDLLSGQGDNAWMSNVGKPGDPWYQKPLSPGYGPDPLNQSGQPGQAPNAVPATVPPQSPPVSGKPEDPAAQGTQPAGPGASNEPTFPNQIPSGGQPSAAGIPQPPQGGPLAGAPPVPANSASPQQNASYMQGFGGHSTLNGQAQSNMNGLNPDFGKRLAAAGQAYKQQTGQDPQYGEGYRDNATQAQYWRKLQGGRLGPVAPPGRSLHNRGLAMDMPSNSGFTNWLRAGNAQRFGLGFPVRGDPYHIQMTDNRGNAYPYLPPSERGVNVASATGGTGAATSANPQMRATATHPGLAQARQPFKAQLQNPNTARLLAASTLAEVGGQGPLAEQAYIETVMNRAASRGMTLDQAATARDYYPRTTLNKLGATPSAADTARIQQITQRVLAGSNVSNFGTGNASNTTQFNGGPMTYNPGTGERFGTEGPDRDWAQRVRTGGQQAQQVGTNRDAAIIEAQRAGAPFSRTNWPKFEAEARPSTNVETGPDMAPQSRINQTFGGIGNYIPPGTAGSAQQFAEGGPLAGRPEVPQPVNGMTPEAVQRSAGRQVPSWDVPIKPHPTVTQPEITGGLTGRPLSTQLPEITVKPDTAKAAETGKSKPAPPKTKPKAGMKPSQKRAIQKRAASRPPPVPKLSPYGSTSEEYERSKTAGYVQPGETGYDRSMRYYYGR